ncbi:hypothetical protein PENTCL1PPCAC_7059, partial [Pristionchus entomophagus]
RGLTHAYWAPNAWAIYNTVDLILNKVINRAGISLPPPEYTTGLVQEYTHTVLPTIGMGSSVCLVLLSLLPLLSLIRLERSSSSSPLSSPSFHLLLSSLSFFFFGYHVHEKALLLPLIPLIILSSQYAIFSPILLDLTLVVSSSLAPLLFSTPELPLRLGFMLFQFFLTLLFVCRIHHQIPSRYLTPSRVTVLAILSLLEIVNSYLNKTVFPSSPFISLLLISLSNSLILLSIFIRLISLAFPFPMIQWKKWKCLRKESLYRDGNLMSGRVKREEIEIVAAVDIEVMRGDPTLAVISAVFFDINKGEKVDSVSQIIPYPQLYIPHFLALSEESHISDLIDSVMKERPELRPHVIICDGNGAFHPRRFGLACHVGASTGIPTIGMSKNMDWGVLGADFNGRKMYGDRLKKLLSDMPHKLGWAPLDFFLPLPHTLNVISYPHSTRHVFVSAGLGISLDTSTEIVLELMGKGIAPTHEADNLARRIASQMSTP